MALPACQVYGQEIARDPQRAFSTQLYEILQREILRGRWKPGERIPSYRALSEMTGLSQPPIQAAIQKLADEGYVTRLRHKGVFVESVRSPGNCSLGELLIAVGQDEPQHPGHSGVAVATQAFGLVNVQRLHLEAEKLGLRARTIALPVEWEDGVVNGAFERSVGSSLGVVSLLPADRLGHWAGAPGPPVIYLGAADAFSTPTLTGDLCLAAYRVTRHLLDMGHRHIAALPDTRMAPAAQEQAWMGMAHAYAEAGLAVSAEAQGPPRSPALRDLEGFHLFLKENAASTAVLCFSIDDARRMVEVAEWMGLAVPGDLSVASLQTEGSRERERINLVGATYNWTEIIRTCFEILLSPDEFAERSVSRIVFSPHVRPGNTVAPPGTDSEGS